MGTDLSWNEPLANPMEGHNNPAVTSIGGPHPFPNAGENEERKDGLRQASPLRNMLKDSL